MYLYSYFYGLFLSFSTQHFPLLMYSMAMTHYVKVRGQKNKKASGTTCM